MEADPDLPLWTRAKRPGCPLCGRDLSPWDLFRLYRMQVCAACRSSLFNRRAIAFAIDFAIAVAAANAGEWMLQSVGASRMVMELLGTGLLMLFLLKDGFHGLSPGKWLLDLQVIDAETLRPAGPLASLKRNLILLLSWIGVLFIMLDLRYGQRCGDRWAQTMVIRRRYADRMPFDRPLTICRRCGYDLTGNISGICPECSLTIPDRDRKAIAEK